MTFEDGQKNSYADVIFTVDDFFNQCGARESPRDLVTSVLDCDIVVRDRFLVALFCSISNPYSWQRYGLPNYPSCGLNRSNTIILQEWHAIKQSNQTNGIQAVQHWWKKDGPRGRQFKKPNLIWSHSTWISWSAYLLFSRLP